ncbi:NUDIX hydrolase [Chengkuizengella axinellae]|uniref:NUDIX hydrolase n=1 Tax=Chengkuizengella axinellae TaxID=3064388 RepID=A0ABT9J1F5_9BACL|nr:NUDIX hydrolase [Chengkuizengella sp. 2205SS18-9]MDP5275451.1 NUDIX hydrolase [Chengkuizengella sp. 2205SS18-9]
MDIVFTNQMNKFNFRAAAVCIESDHILLTKAKNEDHWFIPGGRVSMMETGEEALERELNEELGKEVEIDRMIWIVENFFTYNEQNFHEICFIYNGTFSDSLYPEKGNEPFFDEENKAFMFQWIPLNQVKSMDIRPEFIKSRLNDMPSNTEHIVIRD